MNANHSGFFFCADTFTLTGPRGQHVILNPIGATLANVVWHNSDDILHNIVLISSDDTDYAGATLAPISGRIIDGILPIAEERIQLTRNEGRNVLHGGPNNASHQRWIVEDFGKDTISAWCRMSCQLAHGLDGFPGQRYFTATYTLTDDAITVQYTAKSDRPTFINMSNHTYWNLSGDFTRNCYDHTLEITSSRVQYNDTSHIPFSICSVAETAFDFSTPITLQKAMERAINHGLDGDRGQLNNALGYNNGFALTPEKEFAAKLTAPDGKFSMTLTTNQPWLVMYSGGYLPVSGCALALEAQGMPTSTAPLLLPNEKYERFIRFQFSYS